MSKICLIISLLLLVQSANVLHAKEIAVNVDASITAGPVPDLLTSSIWIQQINASEEDIYRRFFEENRPAVVQMSLPILKNTNSFDEFKGELQSYLNTGAARTLINGIRSQGATLIIGFDPCPMPVWLSSRPGDHRGITKPDDWATIEQCSPPKDYALWAEVVRHTLTYLQKGLKLKTLGYYVGHEQELQWSGSEAEFFNYYEKTAGAVKSVGRDILVGGVGPAIWNKGRYDCDHLNPDIMRMCQQQGWKAPGNEPFLKNFIYFAGQKKVPLDFINLHSFGTYPQSFLPLAKTIKEWLASSGLKGTPIYISDWTSWNGPYPSQALDTNEAAAYIPQALYYMLKAGVRWQGHDFNVRNAALERSGSQSTFGGDWPIFTKDHIIKPSYNAFKALTLFAGNRELSQMLDTSFPENTRITAFAARQDLDRIAVLMSYYAPHPSGVAFKRAYLLEVLKQDNLFKSVEREIDSVVDCVKNMSSANGIKEKIETCLQKVKSGLTIENQNALTTVVKIVVAVNSQSPEEELQKLVDVTGDELMKKKIDDVRVYIEGLRLPQNVVLQIENLPFSGKAEISTYLIDDTHGNACGLNKRTAQAGQDNLFCGEGGNVDRMVAEAKKVALRNVLDGGMRQLQLSGVDALKVDQYKTQIDQCLSSASSDAVACIKAKLATSPDSENLSKMLKDAIPAFQAEYGKLVDAINGQDATALRAANGIFDIPASKTWSYGAKLLPNTVLLVVMEKSNR